MHTFFNPDREGWLSKQVRPFWNAFRCWNNPGLMFLFFFLVVFFCCCTAQGGRYKSWKRRWFILNDNCLYYFEYTTDKEPRGIIPLENIQVLLLFSFTRF